MAIRVTLVISPGPREVHEESLRVATGCTAWQVLESSALLQRLGIMLAPTLEFGVWGRRVEASQLLHDGDRLEVYRPLRVDPKVARRARFEAQGARAAGLFARKRSGAKAGY